MRTYGRVTNEYGVKTWVEVTTDANGHSDYVWITTLLQCLQLVLGESPFFSNYGIPAYQDVRQQVFPDYYVMQTQQQFSGFFASLTVAKLNEFNPTYNITVLTSQGTVVEAQVAA